jgi:hypothetical protein
MCTRPYRCAPTPAYTGGPPAQFHFHLIQTITVTTTIEIDGWA